MKKLYKLAAFFAFVCLNLPNTAFAQIIRAGVAIDADLYSNRQHFGGGSNTPGYVDWFYGVSGTGINDTANGIIDTIGYDSLRTLLSSTNNIAFSKKSAYPLWDIVNGKMLIIAGYARDHVGGSGQSDSTTFTNGAKNGDDPSTWGTTTGNVNNKTDLVDVFTAFMRDGDSVYDTLYLLGSISTAGANGDRNFDFEYNQTAFKFNPSNGTWSNLGPDGGHTAWRFDSLDQTSEVGDLILACDWTNNDGLDTANIKLWTHDSFHTPGDTMDGKFVWGPDFIGNPGGYGYASVTVPPGTITSMQNDSVGQGQNPGARTQAGPWGTKDAGGVFDTAYDAHHYLDFAINLTLMGVDPAILTTLNHLGEPDPCTPIYYSFMAKSRTSSSFTAALTDFTTPITFDVPDLVDLTTVPDTALDCNSINSIELEGFSDAANLYSRPSYRWTTVDGNIQGATPTGPSGDTLYQKAVTIDQPGTYLVALTKFAGCGADDIDTVVVVDDEVYPIATAWTTLDTANKDSLVLVDSLYVANNHMVLIEGGDSAASVIATGSGAFPSEGISWNWTGKNSFSANTKDIMVQDSGTYMLIVTENRNGCSDTVWASILILPVDWNGIEARSEQNTIVVSWSTAMEFNNNYFTVQRLLQSSNEWEDIGKVDAVGYSNEINNYSFIDNSPLKGANFYRIMQTDFNGTNTHSTVAYASIEGDIVTKVVVSPNPSKGLFSLSSDGQIGAEITVLDNLGRTVGTFLPNGDNGAYDVSNLPTGSYFISTTVNGVKQHIRLTIE